MEGPYVRSLTVGKGSYPFGSILGAPCFWSLGILRTTSSSVWTAASAATPRTATAATPWVVGHAVLAAWTVRAKDETGYSSIA